MNRDVDIAKAVVKTLGTSNLHVALACMFFTLLIVLSMISYRLYIFKQSEKAYYACLEVHKTRHTTENIYLRCDLN